MTVDALSFRSWPGNFECSGEPGLSWDQKDELEGLIKGGCLGVKSRRKDRAVGRSSAGRRWCACWCLLWAGAGKPSWAGVEALAVDLRDSRDGPQWWPESVVQEAGSIG